MTNNKCAIVITDKPRNFNYQDYSLIIGVEKGAFIVKELEDKAKTLHIGDFDSVTKEQREEIKTWSNAKVLDHESKKYSDMEEAIRLAEANHYIASDIDVYVETTGREDQFVNMVQILHKYWFNVISNDSKFTALVPQKEHIFTKGEYKVLSFYIGDEVHIETKGLKWELNGIYNRGNTECVSNEILEEECTIETKGPGVIVIQSGNITAH